MEIGRSSIPPASHGARQPIQASIIAQLILDGYLNRSNHLLLRLLNPFLFLAYRLVKRDRCLVRHIFESVDLILPASHPAPFLRKKNPDYLNFYGRIAGELFKKYPQMSGALFGAGVGCTVASIRSNSRFDIWAYEPNPRFHQLLNRNMLPLEKVEVQNTLSELPDSVRLISIATTLPNQPLEIPPFIEKIKATIVIEIPSPTPEQLWEPLAHFSTAGYKHAALFDVHGIYITHFELDASNQLANFYHYFRKTAQPYFIALFHEIDNDIATAIQEIESRRNRI